MNPFLGVDGYKIFHHLMSPNGTSLIYSNLTPRSYKYAPPGCKEVLVFGTQMSIREIVDNFNKYFFSRPKKEVIDEIKYEYDLYTDTDYNVSHIEALHDLGYLPINIKALPEGTFAPMGVPVLTIYNTDRKFPWITNFLETQISNLIWKPMTSATLGYEFKKLNDFWIEKTDKGNTFHSEWGCHDFSMRGLDSIFATISSGLGHAVSFKGSDSLPVIHGARKYYDEKGFIVGSIPASEHSIQCAYYNGEDYNYVKALLDKFPTGPLGLVADGFNLWKLTTEVLPKLKDQIMARTGGPLVIRPDSGDPINIMCGREIVESKTHIRITSSFLKEGDKYYEYKMVTGHSEPMPVREVSESEAKGVIELLDDIFGSTVNSQGYKVLHPCIRAIYGDSINLERFDSINTKLSEKGYASTNWTAGVGSFTYQFNTRDTFGFAVKSTYQEVTKEVEGGWNHTGVNIFKDPFTDDGTKKSAKGLLQVFNNNPNCNGEEWLNDGNDVYTLNDEVTWKQEKGGLLQTIFKDGKFYNQITLTKIRERVCGL